MTRRARQARFWTTAVVAGLLLAMGVASFARRASADRPVTGVQWVQSAQGPLALTVEPDGAGARAGLRPGDVLVAVDGEPVRHVLDADQLSWLLKNAEDGMLTVSRSGQTVGLRIAPDRVPLSEIYLYLSIVGLAFWISGVFLAARWPNVRGGKLYPPLALSLFAILALSHTGRGDALDWSIFWVDLAAAAVAPALLFHLALVLARARLQARRLWIGAVYAVSALLFLGTLWLMPGARGGAYLFDDPLAALELRDRVEPLLLALALCGAVVALVRAYARTSSTLHRGQVRWVLWGLGVGLGPAVLFYLVPWALNAQDLPTWARFLAVAPLLFVPAAFTAALARYRLHDLDVLLIRGATETSALLATFAVYAAVTFLLREVLDDVLAMSSRSTRYFGFVVAAVSYPQLRSWVRVGVERAFYRKRYSYRATLLEWARELNAETDLPSLLLRLRERIRATVGVPAAEVLVRRGSWRFDALEPEQSTGSLELDSATMERLQRQPAVALAEGALPAAPWARYLFPLKVKGRLRALLAVAERPAPEEPLSSEDRALLGTLAAHAASAIETARLVQEVRQRAEEVETLHAREARILEGSAVGLLLLDEDGRIQAWNRALEAIYGASRDEVLGAKLSEIFPLHVIKRLEAERPGADGDARIFRLGLTNRKGQRVVVNLTISRVDGEGAGDAARVLTVDDVTERVKLEEQLLRQERLASLGLLAAGVAHEINTPLTGISSYTQLLLEQAPDDDGRRSLLQKIETQTQRATQITRSLLNLARPERTALESLDVNASVREIHQLFEPQVRGGAVRLQLDLAEDLPPVLGHRGKLQQVLLNLLINARDAVADDGTIRLVTRAENGSVEVDVVDDGPGIPEEDLPRIFDPFFTTKERGKGTGLGLSICYGIVQEHGGELQVESRPGETTRFRVRLPALRRVRATAGRS